MLPKLSANALVMNDDCQTPLEVARAKGHSSVVRAIEVHFDVIQIPVLARFFVFFIKSFKCILVCCFVGSYMLILWLAAGVLRTRFS